MKVLEALVHAGVQPVRVVVRVCKYTQIPTVHVQASSRTCRGQVERPSAVRGGSRVGLSRAPSSRSR